MIIKRLSISVVTAVLFSLLSVQGCAVSQENLGFENGFVYIFADNFEKEVTRPIKYLTIDDAVLLVVDHSLSESRGGELQSLSQSNAEIVRYAFDQAEIDEGELSVEMAGITFDAYLDSYQRVCDLHILSADLQFATVSLKAKDVSYRDYCQSLGVVAALNGRVLQDLVGNKIEILRTRTDRRKTVQ